jgi:hypothetical protein
MSVDGACIEAGVSWNCSVFGAVDNTLLRLLIKSTKTVNNDESPIIIASCDPREPLKYLFIAKLNEVSE